MNNEVDRFQFLVNGKNKNQIHKLKIRILIERLKARRICDSQPARGECLAPAVEIPYRRPWTFRTLVLGLPPIGGHR